jgi:aldehyde:ferredoxin oxidoreductase
MYPDGKIRQIPEYETTGLFGSNIENYDTDKIAIWNEIMNDMGMDTISAGGTMAWAMEAGEKGMRKTELSFENHDNIARILEDIAYRRGEGAELADGSKRLSEKYGGTNFAIHTKGLEIAAYDPRGCCSWVSCRLGLPLARPPGLSSVRTYLPVSTPFRLAYLRPLPF